MGSTEQLPVICMTSPTLAADIYAACKEAGFFYLTDHGIPEDLTNAVVSLAREFFLNASDAEKAKIQRKSVEEGGDGARGYQVLNENVTKGRRDYHEAIDFYKELDDEPHQEFTASTHAAGSLDGLPQYKFLRGPNLWPERPDQLREIYEEYIEHCKAVGTKIVKAMGEALGEGDIFVNATRNSFWVLRMIGYPPLSVSFLYPQQSLVTKRRSFCKNEAHSESISCGEHTGK